LHRAYTEHNCENAKDYGVNKRKNQVLIIFILVHRGVEKRIDATHDKCQAQSDG